MRQNVRKIVSLLLSFMMLWSMVPTDALASVIISTVVTTSEEYDMNAAKDAFDAVAGDFIIVTVDTDTSLGIGSELVGQPFKYTGKIRFIDASTFRYADTQGRTQLFSAYNNVTLRVKAPDGIELCDESGNALTLDADGWYTVPQISSSTGVIKAGGSARAAEATYSFNVWARMLDNGSVADGSAYDALEVSLTADTVICNPGAYEEHQLP